MRARNPVSSARAVLCATGLVGMLGAVHAGEGRFEACPAAASGAIEVAAGSPEDRRDVCDGAQDAFAFFRARGLATRTPIRINIATKFPERTSPNASGCFAEDRREAFVLPYRSFRRRQTWFRIAIDRTMYRSAAAHEVAHALAACNFAIVAPSIRAKEYVAYVVMFETMKPSLRKKILDAYPEPGFESGDRLTLLLVLFDPMRYGVQSWRHYAQPANGQAFFGRVLAGRELLDE